MTKVARSRIDGVSVAIHVLRVLGHSHGEVSLRELASEVPRSSLYRVIGTLEAAGIVVRTKGKVRIGPVADAIMRRQAEQLRAEPAVPIVRGLRETPIDDGHSATPVVFSRPLRKGPQRRSFRVGFSNISMKNPWRVTLVHSVERAAANLAGRIVNFTVRHAGDSPERQAADIIDLVDMGVDGLVVSAGTSPLVGEAIRHAMLRGTEVVMVNGGIPGIAPTSVVSTSDPMIGRITAQWLAETLNGVGGVLLLPGSENAEQAQLRLRAALATFSAFPGIRILDTAWTGWQRARGKQAALAAIQRFDRQISGVWCDSGLQGVGSMQAFVKCGWKKGTIPPHTGGDLNLAYKVAVRHDIKLAAADCPPAMGMRAVEVLLEALQGRYIPSRVDVPIEPIVTKGSNTQTVSARSWAEDHVRWDLPDDLVLASGLGPAYNPRAFRIHYKGNRYNRSAAQPARTG